jgi:hypothetical protein
MKVWRVSCDLCLREITVEQSRCVFRSWLLSMKMLRNISTLTLAILLLVQSSAQAQNVSGQPEIKARGRGSKLILTSRGKSHVLDIHESVDAAKLDDVSVLFVTRRPGFTYLLIAACGPSRLESNDRQCGAGIECNLLWIKLNAGWKIGDLKSVRYESCWSSITSQEGYKINGHTLRLEYSDFREKKEYKLTYDSDQPESAFVIEESAIKDADSN